jgi:hypothetical protein
MPYLGQTYNVPCITGWIANPNFDNVPNEAMINPRNINIHRGGREPRGGCEAVNPIEITDTPEIKGIYQFNLENGNTFLVAGCSDGTIYTSDESDFSVIDTQLKSGLSEDKVIHFETFYNQLYICNGYDIPQVWDGSAGATSDMSDYPSDWDGGHGPKAMIRHGVRTSKRLWAFGCDNHPNRLYASVSGSDDMSDANVITINIMDVEITAMTEFGGRLLVFSKNKSYIIDDTSLDVADWGYQAAVWEGGAANQNLVIKTPTDILVMSETAEMFSITASQQYGDYQIASLTRPAYLHKWVEDNVDLTKIDQFHGVYDQELRCIKVFMVGIAKNYPDIAMVYFVDMGPQAGWTKHEYLVNQVSSAEVRVSISDWKVYTGGSAGVMYELESETLRDDGEIYRVEFTTPPLAFENPRSTKRYDRLWICLKPIAFETIKVNIYIDDRSITGGYHLVDEYGNNIGDENGNVIVSEPTNPWQIIMEGAEGIIKNYGDDLGSVGRRIQAQVYNDLGENFFISQLMFDLYELGSTY